MRRVSSVKCVDCQVHRNPPPHLDKWRWICRNSVAPPLKTTFLFLFRSSLGCLLARQKNTYLKCMYFAFADTEVNASFCFANFTNTVVLQPTILTSKIFLKAVFTSPCDFKDTIFVSILNMTRHWLHTLRCPKGIEIRQFRVHDNSVTNRWFRGYGRSALAWAVLLSSAGLSAGLAAAAGGPAGLTALPWQPVLRVAMTSRPHDGEEVGT